MGRRRNISRVARCRCVHILLVIPYDGKVVGEFQNDGIPRLSGRFRVLGDNSGSHAVFGNGSGVFVPEAPSSFMKVTPFTYVGSGYTAISFDSALVIPHADSVQPGCIAVAPYIVY